MLFCYNDLKTFFPVTITEVINTDCFKCEAGELIKTRINNNKMVAKREMQDQSSISLNFKTGISPIEE